MRIVVVVVVVVVCVCVCVMCCMLLRNRMCLSTTMIVFDRSS